MHDRHLSAMDAAVPAVVAVVIGVGAGVHGGGSTRPFSIALGVGAAAALAGRRRWPAWTLAASGGLVAVLFHVDAGAGTVAVLAPAVALYSLALRRGRAQQIAAAIVAVGAVVVADLAHTGRPTLGQTLGHALLVAIPLLAAEAMRAHRANLSLAVERLELAERAREHDAQRRVEQERVRIARDVHDVVAHTLTEINVQAAAAAERAEPGEARDALERIEDASHAAVSELRAILGVLRGADATAAPRAPSPGVTDIAEMVETARAGGLDVGLDVVGLPPTRISDLTSLAAYRIVQESLTNARRHAPGTRVTVALRYDTDNVSLAVSNDLTGPKGRAAAAGVGIVGMRERAEAIGGRFDVGPVADAFRVEAELPYQPPR